MMFGLKRAPRLTAHEAKELELLSNIWAYATSPDAEQQALATQWLDTMYGESDDGMARLRWYGDLHGYDHNALWPSADAAAAIGPHVRLPENADPSRDWDRIVTVAREHLNVTPGRLELVDGRWTVFPRITETWTLAEVRPTDGERLAAEAEKRGKTLLSFDPYARTATVTEKHVEAERVRRLVAGFLNVRPWEIDVTLCLKDGHVEHTVIERMPTMPADKREKVAREMVDALGGNLGWKVHADPMSNRVVLSYGEPLHLPDLFSADFAHLLDPARQWVLPYGVDALGREIAWVVTEEPMAMVVGRTGTGKTQAIYPIISAALTRGFELAVCEISKAGGDYEELRPWVRPGGWGCDSKAAASQVIQDIYALKSDRMRAINALGHKKLHSMTRAEQSVAGLKPILLIVDEAAALLAMPPTIKGLAKDDPVAVAVAAEQAAVALAGDALRRISAELRAVGVHLLFASQRYDASLFQPAGGGLLRAQLGHRLVLGTMSQTTLSMSVENTDTAGPAYLIAHGSALTNDPAADVAKPRPGRGIVETGTATRPVQVAYAPTEDWVAALEARHLPTPGGSAPKLDGALASDGPTFTSFSAFSDSTPEPAEPFVDTGFSLDATEPGELDLSHLVTNPEPDDLWN